jgi:hypothetical protein
MSGTGVRRGGGNADGKWLSSLRAVQLIAVVLAVAVVGVAVSGAVGTGAAYSPSNSDWDGTSGLVRTAAASGAGVGTLVTTADYARLDDRTVALVLSPATAYSDDDIESVRRFVERGGMLVVAEDFGQYANPLLAGVGASARVDGRLVRDERFESGSPALPVARDVRPTRLTDGIDAVVLNYGTVVRPGEATVLVATSPFAYLDADRDGRLDGGESLDAYPIVTVEPVGAGRVVVVSDPSVFVNAMQERSGNRQLVVNLATGVERVVVDVSHAEQVSALSQARSAVNSDPRLQLAVLGTGIAIVAGWLVGPSVLARLRRVTGGGRSPDPGLSTEEARQLVASAHPDWDATRVDRVVVAFRERAGRR